MPLEWCQIWFTLNSSLFCSKSTCKIWFFQNCSGFVLQSVCILGLKYKVSFMIEWILTKNYNFGGSIPAFFLRPSTFVEIDLKSLKIKIFAIFQLWHLKLLKFSSYYHFIWFWWPFWPFFFKKQRIMRSPVFLGVFWRNSSR